METVREEWTDARLDDLNHRVDTGFEGVCREFQVFRMEVRTEFAAVRSEMATEFAAVRSEMATEFAAVRSEMATEFAAVRTELTEIRGEMAALNRTLIQIAFGAAVTLAVGFGGTIVTVLTQV